MAPNLVAEASSLIESSNPQQRVQDSSGASHESFKYTIITVVLCQWIAIGWFTYHMSCKLNQTYQDMYDQLSLLSDVQKFLDGETQGISDALDEVEGDLRNELRNLNDSQKTELDKASLSIASIWSEIYKIRQEFKVNSFIGFNPTMAANPPSPVLGVPTPPAPTNPPAAPVPMYDFYSTKKFATNNNRSNILKTGYGAFDLSTKEGREKWIRSMKAAQSNHNSNNPANNNKTNNASKPTQLFMTKAETKQQPQDKRYAARTENSGSASPQTKPDNKLPVIPLTSNELKQKLEEGEKKQYRRLFIPGRGWMSAKRLQEESQLLEKAETEAAAASAYAVTSPTSAEPTNAATTESSNVVSTFPDDPATATKISQQ
ncbi:hypothetical protein TRICI_000477 [Trichomonascus ciferrii]|uniref:Uncharacterized protein n=1 Tax=Trichomonascus ciferrii TaxID=44093 RepID=A0A642VDA1_9ASCO|nr:hypothetical protein TRICI_000477 [Trichomonascus ciferrii]